MCEAVALAWKGRSMGMELGRKGEGSGREDDERGKEKKFSRCN